MTCFFIYLINVCATHLVRDDSGQLTSIRTSIHIIIVYK